MEERRTFEPFRPYVPADEESPRQGAHRSAGSASARHAAATDGQEQASSFGSRRVAGRAAETPPGQTLPMAALDDAYLRVRTGAEAETELPIDWRPPAGRPHWNWIIATSAVLGVAVAVLMVVLTTESATSPTAGPPGGVLDALRTAGTSSWFPPDALDPLQPATIAPAPSNGGPPALPRAGAQAAVQGGQLGPGAPPNGSVTTTPAPGGTSAPAQNATAYDTTQGETFDGDSGVKAEADKDGSGSHIGFISTGDWVRYDNVGFTDKPADTLLIRASNAARENRTGQVELRLDSRSNSPIGSMTIANNGDWFSFKTYSMRIQPTTGVHTVYLTFTSNQNEEFANVDWLRFQH